MADFLTERYFFDVPIYSMKEVFFWEAQKRFVSGRIEWSQKVSGMSRERTPELYAKAEMTSGQEFGNWQFSQIVGWIRLFVLGSQVRGETWMIRRSKHITARSRDRQFRDVGKEFEIHFSGREDSQEIFGAIRNAIQLAARQPSLRNRFVDIGTLETIAPFVDWKGLVNINRH